MAETKPPSQIVTVVSASGPDAAGGVLVSTLSERGVADALRQVVASGMLTTLIPDLEVLKGVVQPKEHYWDVFWHSVETAAAVEFAVDMVDRDWPEVDLETYLSQSADGEHSRLIGLKLAALLHDVAKPQTKFVDRDGKMHFYGHSELGAVIAGRALACLGFSATMQGMVSLMIVHHLRPGFLTTGSDSPSDRAVSRFFRDTGGTGIETLILNLADHRAMRGPSLDQLEWQEHVDRTRSILRRYQTGQDARKLPSLVDGDELMDALELPPSRLVGRLLSAIERARATGDLSNKEEAIALAKRLLAGEADR